jgi:hypothetical protein
MMWLQLPLPNAGHLQKSILTEQLDSRFVFVAPVFNFVNIEVILSVGEHVTDSQLIVNE